MLTAEINKELKRKFPVKERYHVWDVIIAWRDHIYSSSFMRITKSNYLTGMLKLIEAEIINPSLLLKHIDDTWLEEAKAKIDNMSSWSRATKPPRKTCLLSFYQFASSFEPDYTKEEECNPFGWIPTPHEIKYHLSSVQEKALSKDLNTRDLLLAMREINERDAIIVSLMIFSGCTLEEVLDLRKEDIKSPYIQFKHDAKAIPLFLIELTKKLGNESSDLLFVSAKGKRLNRTQVMRNLKLAGKKIGLRFDLTPKILHGYVNAYFCKDKRSGLVKLLSSGN